MNFWWKKWSLELKIITSFSNIYSISLKIFYNYWVLTANFTCVIFKHSQLLWSILSRSFKLKVNKKPSSNFPSTGVLLSSRDCTQTEQTLTCWRDGIGQSFSHLLHKRCTLQATCVQAPNQQSTVEGGKSLRNLNTRILTNISIICLLWTARRRLTRDPWYSGKHSSGPRKSGKSTAGKREKLLFLSLSCYWCTGFCEEFSRWNWGWFEAKSFPVSGWVGGGGWNFHFLLTFSSKRAQEP